MFDFLLVDKKSSHQVDQRRLAWHAWKPKRLTPHLSQLPTPPPSCSIAPNPGFPCKAENGPHMQLVRRIGRSVRGCANQAITMICIFPHCTPSRGNSARKGGKGSKCAREMPVILFSLATHQKNLVFGGWGTERDQKIETKLIEICPSSDSSDSQSRYWILD